MQMIRSRNKWASSNQGQASLEMALIGSLILAAMVTLFSYTRRLNDEQRLTMQAFRNALRKAKQCDGIASYVALEHNRYSVGDFFRRGSVNTVSGQGVVYWGKGDGDENYWRINNQEITVRDNVQIEDQQYAEKTTETKIRSEDSDKLYTAFKIETDKDTVTLQLSDGSKISQDITLPGKIKEYKWITPQ